jgi:hypothetical protein
MDGLCAHYRRRRTAIQRYTKGKLMNHILFTIKGRISAVTLAAFLLWSPALWAQGSSMSRTSSGSSGSSRSGSSGSNSPFSGSSGSSGTSTSSGFQGSVSNLSQITSTGSGRGSYGASSTTGPTSTNPFLSNYAYPQQAGLTNASSGRNSGSFGQQLYYATVSTTGNTGFSGTTATTVKVPSFYTSFGLRRDLPYTSEIGESMGGPKAPLVAVNSRLLAELRSTISRSTALSPNSNVRVSLVGDTALLQGVVADSQEARLAEGLIRVTPGVRDVRNELTVKNGNGGVR